MNNSLINGVDNFEGFKNFPANRRKRVSQQQRERVKRRFNIPGDSVCLICAVNLCPVLSNVSYRVGERSVVFAPENSRLCLSRARATAGDTHGFRTRSGALIDACYCRNAYITRVTLRIRP